MPELQILRYLEKEGPTNTFRLARVLGIDMGRIRNIIKRLEAKGALSVKNGVIQFLRFLPEEKKETFPKMYKLKNATTFKKTRKRVGAKQPKALQTLQLENKQLKETLTVLRSSVTELEKKANARSKTITKTIIRKVRSPPKIITKIVTKQVPVTKIVIKKSPMTLFEEIKVKIKKFKLPQFKVMKNIKVKIKKFKLPQFKVMKNIKVKLKKFKLPKSKVMEKIKLKLKGC